MVCKTKALQYNHKFDTKCNFYDAWNAPGVQLPSKTLGANVQYYRNTRNNMQHSSAAATVDEKYCASAILNAVKVVDHCWKNTSRKQLAPWMKSALRIVRLYSPEGDLYHANLFSKRMEEMRWRSLNSVPKKESLRVNAIQIFPGRRDHWFLAIRTYAPLIEACLNELEIP
jgi:hypothetical protein